MTVPDRPPILLAGLADADAGRVRTVRSADLFPDGGLTPVAAARTVAFHVTDAWWAGWHNLTPQQRVGVIDAMAACRRGTPHPSLAPAATGFSDVTVITTGAGVRLAMRGQTGGAVLWMAILAE